ncbi:allatostatin [Leguminivora glycinivorella]|uniref:allatostatin n=1 Tax=Leguminivora glycinivorella TaxID=1035111 RepID=UPI00200F0022|nr:allatostatin [Leguminivora glycinivorella]
MKCSSAYSSMFVFVCSLALLLVSVNAAPMEPDEEQSENALVAHDSNDMDASGMSGAPWDAINSAALRKLLLQLDAEERLGMGRVGRSWPQAEPRGWSRSLDGRLVRPWRADKRQVRFRQCYFNPISCFRK